MTTYNTPNGAAAPTTTPPSAALARHTPADSSLRTARDAFEPASFPEAIALATSLIKSGLMPKALNTPEAVVTAIVMGRELGLTAMQSVRSIHVIEGKPSMSSALIVGLVKKATDVCAYFRLVESTDEVATYETLRKGDPEPTKMSFTLAHAKAAGVTGKDNWRRYPAAMLRARCETALARAVYPDLVMGLYDPDEVEPTEPRDVTPGASVPAAPRNRRGGQQAAPPVVESPKAPEPPAEPERVVTGTVEGTPTATPDDSDAGRYDEATGEMESVAAKLTERVGKAASQDDLNKLAGEIKLAQDEGKISPLERQALVAVYTARSNAIRSGAK